MKRFYEAIHERAREMYRRNFIDKRKMEVLRFGSSCWPPRSGAL